MAREGKIQILVLVQVQGFTGFLLLSFPLQLGVTRQGLFDSSVPNIRNCNRSAHFLLYKMWSDVSWSKTGNLSKLFNSLALKWEKMLKKTVYIPQANVWVKSIVFSISTILMCKQYQVSPRGTFSLHVTLSCELLTWFHFISFHK